MAGGNWVKQNKVRPGAYINTVSALPEVSTLVSGRLLLATELATGWGATGVVELEATSDFKQLLGYDLDDPKLQVLKEAFRGAQQVVLVNNNGGAKASATLGTITATAKYAGDKGNNIVVDFINEGDDGKHYTITTLFDGTVADEQRITSPEELEGNNIVDFKVSDTSTDLSSFISGENAVSLTGGTTEQADMTKLLGDAVQSQFYNVATTAGYAATNPIHALLVQLIKMIRNNTGYKATVVVPKGAKDYNADFVSVVANGVQLADGTKLDQTVTAAAFAGMSASVPLDQSLTYKLYPEAVDTLPTMTNDSIINALKAGRIVFTKRKNGAIVIEQDVDNLTNDRTKLQSFKKNRIIRTLDYINNATQDRFEERFVGKVSNNADGRDLFKADRLAFFNDLAKRNIIERFDPADLRVGKGDDSDAMTMDYAVVPIDSIEKLYMTITVNK